MLTRRELGLIAAAALLSARRGFTADSDVLDEALGLLTNSGPEFGGLSNHGPMAAEALVALGRPDAVLPFVTRYRRRLQPAPSARNPISGDGWRGAIGDFSRAGDWVAYFERELAAAPWRHVLATWLPRLAPGLVAALFHGLIRTAHATRGLGRRETPRRRNELARALGYWATRHQPLPARAGAAPRGARPSQIVPALERAPASAGRFADAVAALAQLPSFPGVIDRVDTSGDAAAFLSNLTATFARAYLANATTRTIFFVHGVTGPSAARLLLPFVPQEAQRDFVRFTWQAAAGLYCAYGQQPPVASAESGARDDLADRAIATGDEHAIKMTEACLREHAINPDAAYLAAARDVCTRL